MLSLLWPTLPGPPQEVLKLDSKRSKKTKESLERRLQMSFDSRKRALESTSSHVFPPETVTMPPTSFANCACVTLREDCFQTMLRLYEAALVCCLVAKPARRSSKHWSDDCSTCSNHACFDTFQLVLAAHLIFLPGTSKKAQLKDS